MLGAAQQQLGLEEEISSAAEDWKLNIENISINNSIVDDVYIQEYRVQ